LPLERSRQSELSGEGVYARRASADHTAVVITAAARARPVSLIT
jgi:hypothetical protein